MSYFKKPPVYAEHVMGMVEAAQFLNRPGFTPRHVLQNVLWRFYGGRFGTEADVEVPTMTEELVNVTSGTELPDGTAAEIASAMKNEWDLPSVLESAFGRRRMTGQARFRARNAEVFATLHAATTAEGRQVVTGMRAVYHLAKKIHTWAMTAEQKDVRDYKHRRVVKLAKRLVLVQTNVCKLDPESLEANMARFEKLMSGTAVEGLSKVVAALRKALADAKSPGAWKMEKSNWHNAVAYFEQIARGMKNAAYYGKPNSGRMIGNVMLRLHPLGLYFHEGQTTYVFPQSDANKLGQLITGIRNVYAASCAAVVGGTPAQMRGAIDGLTALE